MRSRPLFLVPLLSLLQAGCHFDLGKGIKVDGVRLPAHHVEVLTVEAWPESGLTVAARIGDVRVEYFDGPTTITLEIYERTTGEAHARLENGRLVAEAPEKGVCAIGRTVVRTRGPLSGLDLATGCGDVEVAGVEVAGRIALSTGKGDVSLRRAGRQDTVEIDTGMGDVTVANTQCARMEANTGFGDVSVDAVEVAEAALESGLGDVEVTRSRGGKIRAETGLGDIEFVESSFDERELDTGMGSVHAR